jgi:hypothetical protein
VSASFVLHVAATAVDVPWFVYAVDGRTVLHQ